MTAPMPPLSPDFADEIRATLEWWRLAGVDCDFADYATDWLDKAPAASHETRASSASHSQKQSPAEMHDTPPDLHTNEPARIDPFAETKPQTLEEFRTFWLEAPGLDAIGPRGRVAPRGKTNASLMVLVVDPEEDDSHRLLCGPRGRLLDNILLAMGLCAEDCYVASALPRPTPMADTEAIARGGMDAVLSRHIELASPQKLLAFGTDILPLLGLDAKDADGHMRSVDRDWRSTPLLVSEGLDSMMAMPRLKARFWRRFIEWSQKT